MVDYYEEHFENICKMDKGAANLVLNALIFDGIEWSKKCEEGGNILEPYSKRYEIAKKDFLFIILLFIVISSFYFYKKERRKFLYIQLKESLRNNRKFLFILLFLTLLIMGFYISSKISIVCSGDH